MSQRAVNGSKFHANENLTRDLPLDGGVDSKNGGVIVCLYG